MKEDLLSSLSLAFHLPYDHPNSPANIAAMATQRTVHREDGKDGFLGIIGVFLVTVRTDFPARISARDDILDLSHEKKGRNADNGIT